MEMHVLACRSHGWPSSEQLFAVPGNPGAVVRVKGVRRKGSGRAKCLEYGPELGEEEGGAESKYFLEGHGFEDYKAGASSCCEGASGE